MGGEYLIRGFGRDGRLYRSERPGPDGRWRGLALKRVRFTPKSDLLQYIAETAATMPMVKEAVMQSTEGIAITPLHLSLLRVARTAPEFVQALGQREQRELSMLRSHLPDYSGERLLFRYGTLDEQLHSQWKGSILLSDGKLPPWRDMRALLAAQTRSSKVLTLYGPAFYEDMQSLIPALYGSDVSLLPLCKGSVRDAYASRAIRRAHEQYMAQFERQAVPVKIIKNDRVARHLH